MNIQKIKSTAPLKPSKTVDTYEKPDMYFRINKEKERIKKINIFTRKTELKLIYKYFSAIKQFHNYKQYIKKKILRYKHFSFSILKYNYLKNYEKYDKIIDHFDLKRKFKVFYLIYNEYIIASKKNYLMREFFTNNFNIFINNTKNSIVTKYNTFSNTQRYFFALFISKTLLTARMNQRLMNNKAIITKHQMDNAYLDFIKYFKQKVQLKNNITIMTVHYSYNNFFSKVTTQINMKNFYIKKIFDFKLNNGYKMFMSQIKMHFKESNKIIFTNQFYFEKLQRKALTRLKSHLIINNKFRQLISNRIIAEQEMIKLKIKNEREQLDLLIQKYREYKQNKLIPIKKLFLDKVKKQISNKKINNLAREFAEKMKKRKIFIELGKHCVKSKNFKIFLMKFQRIYKINLKRNYLNLMQYKVHKFLSDGQQNDIPHIVNYYLTQKFNDGLIRIKIMEMKSFIKKCKYLVYSKKIQIKKSYATDIFYSKVLKIKTLEGFKLFHKYINIKNKFDYQIKSEYMYKLYNAILLSQKEKITAANTKRIELKRVFPKFCLGMILNGVDIYKHKNKIMRKYIIEQAKNNLIDENDVFCENDNKNLLASLVLFKAIVYIIYKKIFNFLKIIILKNRYEKSLIKKYLGYLNQAQINQREINAKMNLIKDDVLNKNDD